MNDDDDDDDAEKDGRIGLPFPFCIVLLVQGYFDPFA